MPVNAGGDEPLPTTVDVADMLKIFGEEDFGFMNEDGNALKLRALTVPEEEGDDPEDTFAAVDSWTDGGFVNEEGYFIGEDDKGIEVGLTEESFNEGNIDFHVWNNPDAGISFADGKTVKTQLCISNLCLTQRGLIKYTSMLFMIFWRGPMWMQSYSPHVTRTKTRLCAI